MKCPRCGNYLDEAGVCSCGYDYEFMVDHANRPIPTSEEPNGQIVLPSFEPLDDDCIPPDVN